MAAKNAIPTEDESAPEIQIAAKAYDANTENAVITGTRHIVADGEPLCGNPHVRKHVENERYHVEAAENPVNHHSVCETCAKSYLANHGSNDETFAMIGALEQGEWVAIETPDGERLTGRVRSDVDGGFPSRYVTVVLSDEAQERWVYGVDEEVRLRKTEGETIEALDGDVDAVESIERIDEPANSVDRVTRRTMDKLERIGGDDAHNVLAVGSDRGKYGMYTTDNISSDALDRLTADLKRAGFEIVDVTTPEDRDHDHTDATYIKLFAPESTLERNEPEICTDGGRNIDDSENKHTGNPEGDRFTKLRGAEYDRVNDLLRDQTTLTAREWAIARVCNDFRTETGVEMTAAGQALPDIVPFMDDEYSAGAVSSAKNRFDTKIQEAAGTLLYGALCGVYTSDELDNILYKATETAKFLMELEGGRVDHEHEIDAEQQLADAMREVRETSLDVRDRIESEGDDGGE